MVRKSVKCIISNCVDKMWRADNGQFVLFRERNVTRIKRVKYERNEFVICSQFSVSAAAYECRWSAYVLNRRGEVERIVRTDVKPIRNIHETHASREAPQRQDGDVTTNTLKTRYTRIV